MLERWVHAALINWANRRTMGKVQIVWVKDGIQVWRFPDESASEGVLVGVVRVEERE